MVVFGTGYMLRFGSLRAPLKEMTPDAQIISTRYTRSVIKSCAALSYVEAQARMDDSRLVDSLTTDLRNLNALAKIMRQRRIDRGALTLASAEVKFQIDTETHDPLDIGNKLSVTPALAGGGQTEGGSVDMHKQYQPVACREPTISKCMPFYSIANLLNERRRHPTPTKEMLEPLLQIAAAVGLDLDISSSKALADSLDRAVAVYFCSGDLSPPEFHHYGLAAPLYTHFTSPIRRYADLNYRHRNAQMASRASVELNTVIYFRKRFGIEGPVYLLKRGEMGEWLVDEVHQKMTQAGTNASYRVLQAVRIHMEVVEHQPNRPKLELTLI
ncbi:hypothetical protein Taro_021093 [Colocasia esculenta]|uniref:RNB domain-containing protein n=1 Tax=Colocasia esculenta TaxID=4460 RepID=A0A843UY17_COLES|nr:hypothetical protein [Colocasia esculenta]